MDDDLGVTLTAEPCASVSALTDTAVVYPIATGSFYGRKRLEHAFATEISVFHQRRGTPPMSRSSALPAVNAEITPHWTSAAFSFTSVVDCRPLTASVFAESGRRLLETGFIGGSSGSTAEVDPTPSNAMLQGNKPDADVHYFELVSRHYVLLRTGVVPRRVKNWPWSSSPPRYTSRAPRPCPDREDVEQAG